jgi:hypothetical protein
MIVTSNSVTHNFTIPSLQTVGQVDSNYDVIEQVTVQIHSSISYDHTYTKMVYNDIGSEGVETTVTETKVAEKTSQIFVNLDTSNISSFSNFDDLEEDTVVQWALDADPVQKQKHMDANEAIVLEEKDKVLNPLKYQKDSPVTPWRKRADQALIVE